MSESNLTNTRLIVVTSTCVCSGCNLPVWRGEHAYVEPLSGRATCVRCAAAHREHATPGGRPDLADALVEAACEGDASETQRLLVAGADPNAADSSGRRCLTLASDGGHVAVVRALLAAGADPNGFTWLFAPLAAAALRGNLEIVRALIAAGARVNPPERELTPLLNAAEGGHPLVVRELLDRGAAVNAASLYGKRALHGAVECGYATEPGGASYVVRALVAAGADVNVADDEGMTPLMWSAVAGCGATAAFLIAQGADVLRRNRAGETAIDLARRIGAADVLALLENRLLHSEARRRRE